MLLVGFEYHLSVKCLLTNGSMKNRKSALKLQCPISRNLLTLFGLGGQNGPEGFAKYLENGLADLHETL